MTGEAQPPAPPEPPAWKGEEWGFEWNGKKIVPDTRDKLMTWASQGYNYSQRMGELNKLKADTEKWRSEWEPKVKRYSEVDDYVRQNPQWWQFVEEQWQRRQQPQGLPPELEPVLKPLQSELSEVKQFVQQMREREAQENAQKQDQALDQEVQSIRKQFPNIDMNAVDASGETLELRILKHANATGIPTFKAAFLDYLSDRLPDLYRAEGREAVAKTQQAAAKAGLLGRTPAPVKAMQPAQNVKGRSYDQLTQEALAELGIA